MIRQFTLYKADYRQKATNADYPHRETITSLQDLLRTAGKDHIFSEMKNNHRAEDNYISTDGIILDIDNTFTNDPDEWKTIDDITEALPEVMFYYVESRNHMKPKKKTNSKGVTTYEEARPKYHLYFPLSKRITDHDEINRLMLEAAGLYCYMDLASAEPQHFFYGVQNAQGGEIDGTLTIDEYITACGEDLQNIIAGNLDEYEQNVKAGLYSMNTETKKAITRLNGYIGRQATPEATPQEEYSAADPIAWIDDAERDKQVKWFEGWAEENGVELGKRYKVNTKAHPNALVICVICPWEDEHSMNGADNETVIIIDAGGQLHFLCRHSHGAGLSWKDYRKKVEEESGRDRAIQEGYEQHKALQETPQEPYDPLKEIDSFLEVIQTEKYKPVPTGINNIDDVLDGGIIRQQLVMLMSAPGMGKTTLAQQIIEKMAQNGHTVLYFNLEMSKEQMIARSLARMGEDLTATQILQAYNLTEQQRKQIAANAQIYKENIAPYVFYNPAYTDEEGRNRQANADLDGILLAMKQAGNKARKENKPAPIICVDYLHLIRSEKDNDITGVIKRAVEELKDYAIKYNTIVILISASNRSANKTGKATIDSGRDTSNIEYGADIMLSLNYRASDKKDGESAEDIADKIKECRETGQPVPEEYTLFSLRIVKSRFTEVYHHVVLKFDGKHSRFIQKYNEFRDDTENEAAEVFKEL